MDKINVLVIQENESILGKISGYLGVSNLKAVLTPTIEEGIAHLQENHYEIVILDDKLYSDDYGSLLHYISYNYDEGKIFVITQSSEIPEVVRALRTGADDYLSEPFGEEDFRESIDRMVKQIRLRSTAVDLSTDHVKHPEGLIGKSEKMEKVYFAISKAANIHETVLITGESGTGKEVAARAIHKLSGIQGDFIPVNCGAIPASLLESELFGHEKGAYTGAHEDKNGFFQTANNGTIFLDELGNTTFAMQAKLLRVLENNQVWKVGARSPDQVMVRIIGASNRNLRKLVEDGEFRDDLYYRLNIIRINLPPLRERDGDILLLCKYFTEKFSSEIGIEPPKFSEEVLTVFLNYSWPGNVRELQNIIKRMVAMGDRKNITILDLPPSMESIEKEYIKQGRSLEEIEGEHIRKILEQTGGNKSKAAEILGITRKTLSSKIKRNGLNRSRP